MTRAYPERNPFPFQAAADSETDTAKSIESRGIPTLVLQPLRLLRSETQSYLSSFSPSAQKAGEMVILRGGHGAGKTHAILYLMEQLESRRFKVSPSIPTPKPIYVKVDGPNFMSVYRILMEQVPLETLTDLSLRYLAVVAGEQFGQEMDSQEASQRAVERLRQDPENVFELFDRYLVEQGAAKEQQIQEIARKQSFSLGQVPKIEETGASIPASAQIAGTLRKDFQQVFSYLFKPDMALIAYQWLKGQTLSESDYRSLGVKGPIITDEQVRFGLELLTLMFDRAGVPFIIFIDQYEKLVLDPDPALAARNNGMLRTLVELIPGRSGMFVIAGNEQAWLALSLDLRQRFAGNLINFPALTFSEACSLVQLYITSSSLYQIQTYDLASGEKRMYLGGHALPVRGLAVSPDGKRLLSASKDGSIKLWDLSEGTELRALRGHSGAVNDVAFSPDGRLAVSASDDTTLKAWDLESGQEVHTFEGHSFWVNTVAISSDGRRILSGSSDKTLRLWDLESGEMLVEMKGHQDTVWDAVFTPHDPRAVSASGDGSLRIWDLESGKLLNTLYGHMRAVYAVRVLLDGKRAASVSDDGTLQLWDLNTGSISGSLQLSQLPIRTLAAAPDDRVLVCAGLDRTIKIIELTGNVSYTIKGSSPTGTASALAISPDNSLLFISGTSVLENEPGELENEPGEMDLYPFNEAAVKTILSFGGGNIRRLLQISHQAFELAFNYRKTVDESLVQDAVARSSEYYFDRQSVQNQIEGQVAARGLASQGDYQLGSAVVDTAVLDTLGRPRLLIKVSRALFYDDEAREALGSLNLVQEVQHARIPAQILLVVMGYVSPEVEKIARQFAHEYIVYDQESFRTRFDEVLDRLQLAPTSLGLAGPGQVAPGLNVNELTDVLENLLKNRLQDAENVRYSVTQVVNTQAMDRYMARRDDARTRWVSEHRKILEDIKKIRKEREQKELEELERLRQKAENYRNSRFAIIFGSLWLAGSILGSLLMYQTSGLSLLTQATGLYLIAMFGWGVICAGPYVLTRNRTFSPQAVRELYGPVNSLEELDRLAHTVVLRAEKNPLELLYRNNPQVRYAGVIAAQDVKISINRLTSELMSERSAIVRRALAQSVANRASLKELLDTAYESAPRVPESAYLIEGLNSPSILRDVTFNIKDSKILEQALDSDVGLEIPDYIKTMSVRRQNYETDTIEDLTGNNEALKIWLRDYQTENLKKLPNQLVTLAEIIMPGIVGKRFNLVTDLVDAMHGLEGNPDLKRAFDTGLDRADYPELANLPKRSVQEAIDLVSPFEDGGLGTFDHLRSIDKIDSYYLFFRQIMYYLELEVLSAPMDQAAP